MWEILLSNADWDCFRTLILREILKIQNRVLEEHCAFFGSHTFVPISWMCQKQTSVSHSSTESEIISLDTGLMGCLLWNCGIQLFLFLEMFLVFQIDRGNLMVMFTNVISLSKEDRCNGRH